MIALVISLLLIVVLWILKKYTTFMSDTQFRFIMISSVLYIILLGIVMSMLTSSKKIMDILMDNSLYIPLIFYILWYVSSASISKLYTGKNNYQGFFDNSNKYMSERQVMP
jgi:uncharacterized membrane protein